MESLVPQLIHSMRKSKSDPVIGLSELLLSFVAAYKDIPSERRSWLFKFLVNKTSPDDCLHALLVLLIDKYSGTRHQILEFAAELMAQQNVTTQLSVHFIFHCKLYHRILMLF